MNKPAALCDLLGSKAVLADLAATDKKQIIQALAQHAAAQLGLEEHVVFDVLWEREKLGTTGVGQGIAIPHGRVAGLEKVCGFFVRLGTPVDFDSIDQRPVDLVFLLLAPESAGADHLHALAAVSRVLRDDSLCEKLRQAKSVSALSALLCNTSTAEAA
ncbi:MAG: PTS IIA-like nitrogen regulatory protein PtsN [Bdellovibrionales bacterium]|jgi:PTS system nitrogen regulatory IIA component